MRLCTKSASGKGRWVSFPGGKKGCSLPKVDVFALMDKTVDGATSAENSDYQKLKREDNIILAVSRFEKNKKKYLQ